MLTAGHCINDGVNRTVTFDSGDAPSRTIGVNNSDCLATPCARWKDEGDVALVTLAEDAGDLAAAASSAEIGAVHKVLVVGFGRTEDEGATPEIKRMVEVPITSPDCTGTVSGVADSDYYGCLRQQELVAGSPVADRDACTGDSGGGVYVQRGSDYLLAGVTSRRVGREGRECGDGGIYVRIDGRVSSWLSSKGVALR